MSSKMNSENTGEKPDFKARKVNASIVLKLNNRFLLRLIGIFLTLDLLLFAAAGTQSLISIEKQVTSAVEAIQEPGSIKAEELMWLESYGINISVRNTEPKGLNFPGVPDNRFFGKVLEGARSFYLPKEAGQNLLQRLDSLIYIYEFSLDGQTFSISMKVGDDILRLKHLMLFAFIVELLLLLTGILPGMRMIRTTLRPIGALAEAAQNLNVRAGGFSSEKVENLKDTLDSINAEKLDMRISLDETESELKNLAEAINSLLDRINETYRSQIRFVSDASHELRTPIAVIEGYANLLDRWGKRDEKTLEEGITAIKDEASNMKDLVEQLLFLARGDNNTMNLQFEHFDLAQLGDEVLRESQMIDGGHDYDSSTESIYVYADKGLIKQALRILVDNAIKYTNAGGKITLSISGKDGKAVLAVSDEGIGIAPEAVSQIFDRFYRADQSRARATGGSGLGLSIAKWIAERHGGHMEVLSRQGIGTKVSIAIPSSENEGQ